MSLLWSKITKSVQEYSHMRYIGHKELELELEFIVLKRMYKGTRWHAYISLRSKLKMTTKLYHPYPFPER